MERKWSSVSGVMVPDPPLILSESHGMQRQQRVGMAGASGLDLELGLAVRVRW